jgi:hypothetical protein
LLAVDRVGVTDGDRGAGSRWTRADEPTADEPTADELATDELATTEERTTAESVDRDEHVGGSR